MGIYIDNTTPKEDADIILDGIKDNKITEDFYIVYNCTSSKLRDEDLVWISKKDPRQHLLSEYEKETIIINGVEGYLTKAGIDYIYQYLMSTGRFSTTY